MNTGRVCRAIGTAAVLLACTGTAAMAPAPQQSGEELYTEHCAVCHGADGTGNGPLAVALKEVPSDLTGISRRNGGRFPRDEVYRTIEGTRTNRFSAHGGGDMPIWGERLSRPLESTMDKINAIVAYLEQLQAPN